MAQFRKKPVVIEAVLWKGYEGDSEVEEFLLPEDHASVGLDYSCPESGDSGHAPGCECSEDDPLPLLIQTKEGIMRADPGDWIIRGVQGELYPCKPDIFEATYEAVE